MRQATTKPPPTNRGVRFGKPLIKNPKGLRQQASVDWVTATTTKAKAGEAWRSFFHKNHTGKVSPTKFFGFQCDRDENGLTYGQRPSDGRFIVILAGATAGDFWREIVPVACKVTRLDLAVDLYAEKPIDAVKNAARLVMSKAYETNRKYTVFGSMAGGSKRRSSGDTLYIGSRQSAAYGRLYDKGLQTKMSKPGKWFRYEIEYKDYAASQAAKAAWDVGTEGLSKWIRKAVYDWFEKRDVVPVFLPDRDVPSFHVRSFVRATTLEKKLLWLSCQVRPTVKYLIENGLRDEAIEALGLVGEGVPPVGHLTERSANGTMGRNGGAKCTANTQTKEL